MSGSCRGLHKCIGRAYSPRLQSNSQVGSLRLRRAAQPVIPADRLRRPLNSNVGRLRESQGSTKVESSGGCKSESASRPEGRWVRSRFPPERRDGKSQRAFARAGGRSQGCPVRITNESPARSVVGARASVWLTGHGCEQTAGFARFGYAVPPNPSFQRTGFAIR